MTNVTWTIRKANRRQDGSWRAYVLLTHGRRNRYIPTSVYVTERDLTPKFKVKNWEVKEVLDSMVLEYRRRLNRLDLQFKGIDIDAIVRALNRKDAAEISITEYFERVWLVENRHKGGLRNYRTAMVAYQHFLCRTDIMATDITTKMMAAFEESLNDRPRARSQYTSAIAKIFKDARAYYNDEDNGIISIRHSLASYHSPKQNVAKKRALSVDVIRRIFSLPYKDGEEKRNRALDCFKLSFCLMGMNSADMFWAQDYKDGCVSYCRKKTKDRRSDAALMRTRVPDIIRGVFERYMDDERVFNFHKSFANESNFNKSINQGLKEIGSEIGVEGLQFYAARHSMASIAVNKAGIDRWTVNAMLNHIDPDMRVTELYIERDFTPLDNANEKLLKYVFGDEAVSRAPNDEARHSEGGAMIISICG